MRPFILALAIVLAVSGAAFAALPIGIESGSISKITGDAQSLVSGKIPAKQPVPVVFRGISAGSELEPAELVVFDPSPGMLDYKSAYLIIDGEPYPLELESAKFDVLNQVLVSRLDTPAGEAVIVVRQGLGRASLSGVFGEKILNMVSDTETVFTNPDPYTAPSEAAVKAPTEVI